MAARDEFKNIITIPSLKMPNIGGLGSTFFHKMLEHKDDIAQICATTGTVETYGFLLEKCIRTAIAMQSEGLGPGHHITICSFNHLNCCVPYLAGLFLGVTTASLDPTISLSDTMHLMKQIYPKIIFVGPEAVELIENALKHIEIDTKVVVFGETTKHLMFTNFLRPSPKEKHFVPVEIKNAKDTAVILFSSGTTDLPKGICLSHFSLLMSFYQNNVYVQHKDVTLVFSSMYWISSIIFILHSIMNGSSRLIYPKFDSNKVWDLISNFKVTVLFLSPFHLISMCKQKPLEKVNISSLRYVLSGGGPLLEDQILEFRKHFNGKTICNCYGLTEVSGTALMYRFLEIPEDMTFLQDKATSCGKPILGCSYKIVDLDTGSNLGPNKAGELRIKCQFEMNGYYNMDSSNCWDSDGFIKTGDVAYYDEDNCFYIIDRIKEMLKFQSWHVAPAKIESILLSHPAVQAAIVIGIPHQEDGEHPMGIVTLKESYCQYITPHELKTYVETKVDDRQKLRGGLLITKSLPTTPSGKINRNHVKRLVLCGEI